MIEAFGNHIGSHLGRHLFYWAISQSDVDGLNLRLSELINKFHGPLERGVQVLDHLLTLEEEDFNGHWGSAYAHNYQPEYANDANGPHAQQGNQEVLPLPQEPQHQPRPPHGENQQMLAAEPLPAQYNNKPTAPLPSNAEVNSSFLDSSSKCTQQ